MLTKPDKLKLFTLMGNYPNAMALKEGKFTSDLLDFDFADVKVSNTAFKPLVRDAKFDLAEVAIVTFLQANIYGKPYVLIPATVVGRGQLHTIAYNPERGALKPSDLNGKTRRRARLYPDHRRVGARHSGRGLWRRPLKDQLGHLRGRPCRRISPIRPTCAGRPRASNSSQMLLDGELDAAIVGDKFPDPRLKPLIPDAETANRKWSETHGGVPINHMLVIRDGLAEARPDVVREVYRLFREAKEAAFAQSGAPRSIPGASASRPTGARSRSSSTTH